MTDTPTPSTPAPDLTATLTKARADLAAKAAELADAQATADDRAADQLVSGGPISPAKDLDKLQSEYKRLDRAVQVLEQRLTAADAAKRQARLAELEAESKAIHAEYQEYARMLLAHVLAASKCYVQHTGRDLPNFDILFRNGEHIAGSTDDAVPEVVRELTRLRSEANKLGAPGVVRELDVHVLPTAQHVSAAYGIINSL